MERPPEELVFVVRIWLQGGDRPVWRGHVSEVRSGSRYYVTEPRDVADFIAARLAERKPG